MFHISSGDGTPEVVQERSTLSPSIILVLDGLNVAMGTSKYNQEEVESREEGRRGTKERCFHGQFLSFGLRHGDNKSGKAGKHTLPD